MKLSLSTQDKSLSQTGVTLPQSVCADTKSSSGCPINHNSYFPDIFNDTSEETLERAYKLWVKDCQTVLEEELQPQGDDPAPHLNCLPL